MAASTTLINTYEGPKGKAEVFEVVQEVDGRERVEYAVHFGADHHTVPSMGEAVILAEELSGELP